MYSERELYHRDIYREVHAPAANSQHTLDYIQRQIRPFVSYKKKQAHTDTDTDTDTDTHAAETETETAERETETETYDRKTEVKLAALVNLRQIT